MKRTITFLALTLGWTALAAPPDGTPPTSISAMAESIGISTLTDTYWAALDAEQETAKPRSSAGGLAVVRVNVDASLTYRVVVWGMDGTAAHFHDAPFGQDGPITHALAGGPHVYSGTTVPADAATLAKLARGDLMVNVHSEAYPIGEVRGQILPAPNLFGGPMDGGQEVPPVRTPASGYGFLWLKANGTGSYMVEVDGMSGTMAHAHYGNEGENGGPAFMLSGTGSRWQGVSDALSADDRKALLTCGLYFNVHSTAHRGGEVRGQIKALPTLYQATVADGAAEALVTVVVLDEALAWRIDGDIDLAAAHLHPASEMGHEEGIEPPVVASLQPKRGAWAGLLENFDRGSLPMLTRGGLAVEIYTSDGEEAYGVLEPRLTPFGDGCAAAEMFDDARGSIGMPVGH